jgi:hypothetical protein
MGVGSAGTAAVLFAVAISLASGARAQNAAKASLDEQLKSAGELLERGRTGEYERLLRQVIPKPEEEPLQDSGILSSTGVQYIMWALAGSSYLGANDYVDAERVVSERLRAVEARGDSAAYPVQMFLSLLADIYRLQGKHAAAFPLYRRLLAFNDQLSADFQTRTELGYEECLIVRGDAATAELVSRPPVDPDGSAVGPAFHEDIFNAHAVAMEEAGHQVAATQFEAMIDAGSRRLPAANQQDRDLFRARLMSARKQDSAAEAIYKKWSGYWKTVSAPPSIDPKEFVHIRTAALAAYTHFLSIRERTREAQSIQTQLASMGCQYAMCE